MWFLWKTFEWIFTLYAENFEPFLIWNGNSCDWNGWKLFCFWFSDFWRQRRTNLRARCHNSDKRLDDATWMCCTWLQPLCKCFMFDSCYHMHCEWHVFANGLEAVRVKWHIFKLLRNGLLRYMLYTSPNMWCNSCGKCYGMDCFGTYFTHVQTCDVTRVQSATEWTASVHTLHMSKPVM